MLSGPARRIAERYLTSQQRGEAPAPPKPELGAEERHILSEGAKRQRRSHRGTRIGPIGSMLGRSEDASAAYALTYRSYQSHPSAALQFFSLCDLRPSRKTILPSRQASPEEPCGQR